MVPSPSNANAPSSKVGLPSIQHHPSSSPFLVKSTNSSLSTSSVTIPTKSFHTSFIHSSSSFKQDENSNENALPPSKPPETRGNSALGRWSSSSIPNKRKRDSEPRSVNGSQLREAQEKVEQKRARIAARVPSGLTSGGNASPTTTPVTSLADLYARMRRDSDVSSRQDVPSVLPSSKTVTAGSRRGKDGRPRNTPHGHSSSTSPDPIAISEDDQEIVILKHTRPSSPQVRARFKPAARLAQPTHLDLKLLHKTKWKRAAPKGTTATATANGVDKPLDKSHKFKPRFAVVIPSPPKHPTPRPARVEQDALERNLSKSKGPTLAEAPVPKPPAIHTPTPAPVRPSRSAETILDSVSEHGLRHSRRGMGPSRDFTIRDIDFLLGAVPVPFDFSLSHHRPAARDNGESDKGGEESSLWWYHPIFEARAKADIRRTLSALLPADPAQDPPLPVGGGLQDGCRAEIRPRESRARIWAERLEDAFGPGPLDRGLRRKPRRLARPAGMAKRESAEGRRSQNGTARPGVAVIANSHGSTRRSIELPPPQQQQPNEDAAADVALMASTEAANVSESEASAWTAVLLPLVKGKTKMDETKMAQTSDALGEVERANWWGVMAQEVLKVSKALSLDVWGTPKGFWSLTRKTIICSFLPGERVGGYGAEAWRAGGCPVGGRVWFACACTDVGGTVEGGVWGRRRRLATRGFVTCVLDSDSV
ncbi:hypothetical protein BJV74DRAFT_830415 [Russula compacta]|nr:hypothetical protein BJV74DRAFT_830415 [Russula compacta]